MSKLGLLVELLKGYTLETEGELEVKGISEAQIVQIKNELAKKAKAYLLEKLANVHLFEVSTETVTAHDKLDLNVAPPFETCFLELSETGLKNEERGIILWAALLHEEGPHKYTFALIFSDITNVEIARLRIGYIDSSKEDNKERWELPAIFLQAFSKERRFLMGEEKTNERIKIKTAHGKDFVKIKRIIHVRPRTMEQQEYLRQQQRHIEWSHRFEVVAHWRRLLDSNGAIDYSRIGKDRGGAYTIPGYTYVKEHAKGDKESLVIRKMRVYGGGNG